MPKKRVQGQGFSISFLLQKGAKDKLKDMSKEDQLEYLHNQTNSDNIELLMSIVEPLLNFDGIGTEEISPTGINI